MKSLVALVVAGFGFWGYVYVQLARTDEQQLEARQSLQEVMPRHDPVKTTSDGLPLKGAGWPAKVSVVIRGLHPDGVASEHFALAIHQGGGRYTGMIPGSWGFSCPPNTASIEVILPPAVGGLASVRANICGKDYLLTGAFNSLPFSVVYDTQNGFIVTN